MCYVRLLLITQAIGLKKHMKRLNAPKHWMLDKLGDFGNVVMVTGGRNRGRVGVIRNHAKLKGSFETTTTYKTQQDMSWQQGKGSKRWVSFIKGLGCQAYQNRRSQEEAR
ncbi:hypothetical protein HID58_081640 [Brassica napus]|uniref:Small ribosomal subunit protein eS4 N-terminal domain-containing protein n=2 Tax=Brassica napus TaxID=3708 RepID=A0ABQ7Y8C3_BRANA|nr:hypothetical protein HID58_081640 [Brassica napus]